MEFILEGLTHIDVTFMKGDKNVVGLDEVLKNEGIKQFFVWVRDKIVLQLKWERGLIRPDYFWTPQNPSKFYPPAPPFSRIKSEEGKASKPNLSHQAPIWLPFSANWVS